MTKVNERGLRSTEIRKNAEEALKGKTTDLKKLSHGDAQKLVHELEVHQIELEMQNEELRRAQKELEDARNRYSDLYDFAPIGYFTFDKNGLILQVNLVGAKKLGMERANLINKHFSLYIAPDHKDPFYSHLRVVFKTETQTTCELRLVDKKGHQFDVKLESMPVRDNDGNLMARTAMSDITERKMAEKLSQEARKYAENIIDTVREPFVVLDKDLKVLSANHSFYSTFEVTSDETVGNLIYNIGNRQWDIPSLRTLLEEILPQKTEFINYEVSHKFQTIGQKIMLLNARQIYQEVIGTPIILLAIEDITQRKQTDEELKKHREHLEEMINERTREVRLAKDEAEHANMAKTNFLHTMSHELRTPLNAVLGFSEMLKQKTSGELNEKQERFIDNIITGGKNLHNIIGQILDAVKMYEGTLELRIEKIPVLETLDEIVGAIKEKAAKKNVLLEKNFDPELEYIEADKQKFKQIFINLLDNAVKFSKDEGGTVTINAKKEGDMARFSVSDRGIGIKEENIENIFQKFTQLDSGTSRKYGGTGIGLAISKQFVELHGGKISVKSKYGEGSTFTFLIPLKSKKGEI